MKAAVDILTFLGVETEVSIVSAHRTPQRLVTYAQTAHLRNIGVLIAGAGGAAHLPGMVASFTHLPVIGVPVKSKSMNGIDSLYSIVQMPPGVPVATMAIDGAKNAGIMAAQILAVFNESLAQRVIDFKKSMEEEVLKKAEELEKLGPDAYLGES
jgi:5-(carboxyamino)imidazole ribonucleotide mutase